MSNNESQKKNLGETSFGMIRSSIAAKLILAMVALIILPLAVNWIFYYRSASSDLTNQTGRLAREVAKNTAEAAVQTLEEHIHLLEALAASGEIQNQLRRANQSNEVPERDNAANASARPPRRRARVEQSGPNAQPLQTFKGLFPQYLEVFLTNRVGTMLATTGKASDAYRADEPWWQQTYLNGTGDIYIGKPTPDAGAGTITMLLTVPVRGTSNELLGVLGSTFDARGIVEVLNIVKLSEASRTLIVDPDGGVLFDQLKQLGPEQKLPASLLRASMGKNSRSGWAEAKGFDDKDSIVAYAKPLRTSGKPALERLQWTTVAVMKADDVLAPVTSSIRLQIVLSIIVVFLAVGAAFFLAKRLTIQIKHIDDLFHMMRVGNYKARAKVVSGDELGQMAQELNSMLDDTLKLVQSREERQEMQRAIIKLLDDVSGVADGDLTGVAEVRSDVTGAIADAFNHMTAELCRIIGRVQDVTLQVGSSATETQSAAERLARDSEKQAQQILATREAIVGITTSIRQVSETAGVSKNVAQQSLTTAKNGADAVRDTVKGMNSLREQVQQTSKRIKRLGENSQEIGEIVQLISEIAYRTSVLALNASIQAARAGEAGRGFAVVAEEVEGLAKRSTDATKRIAELVKTIQSGTNEAIAAMEESTREVVEGSNLAEQAGRALIEIESVSTRLAEMIQSISMAAEQQARDSQAISRVMVEISESTQQTASGMKHSASSVNTLAALANDLRLSVASFKLPGNNGNGRYSARD